MQKSTFRLFLILLMVLTIALVAKANPAEYLNNPTFTGDITGWTVVCVDPDPGCDIAYDGSYYGATAGSLRGATAVGQKAVMQGYAWQTIGTDINSGDVVILNLQWSKRSIVSISAGYNTIKAQIAKPSAPDNWVDIWSDITNPIVDGATAWAGPVNLDVSVPFDETGTYKFRWYFDLKSGNSASAQTIAWFDDASLDVSAGVSFSCSTIPPNIQFGTLTTGQVHTALVNTTTTVTAGAGGFTLSIYDSGDTTINPGLYNSTSTPTDIIGSANSSFADTATLSDGTEGYGIQVATTSDGSGALTVASRYANKTGTDVGGLEQGSGNAVEVASSTDAVTGREIVITYKAAISPSNAPGDYKDTITYTCVAN